MKRIGRVFAFALLAVALTKNVLATSAANIEFAKERSHETARSNITRLELLSKPNLHVDSYRNVVGNMFKSGDGKVDIGLEGSRTFGQKRLQLMLMPMLYKLGVIMTMLMVLTVISAKGLFVGLILLVLKLSTFLSKFNSGWHAPHSQQPVHVHLHNSFPYSHPQAYGWDSSGPGSEDHYYYRG